GLLTSRRPGVRPPARPPADLFSQSACLERRSLERFVSEGVAAIDERSLALLRPRRVAAERRVEAVLPGRAPHDDGPDLALVAERETCRLEACVELGAQRLPPPAWR